MTFVSGEQALSRWMAENAFVAWMVSSRPWELESEFIAELDLPLNLDQNKHGHFHQRLTMVRSSAVARARELPIVPNPGVGGR